VVNNLAGRSWGAFVGGAWITPENATWFEVLEPATGESLGRVVAAEAARTRRTGGTGPRVNAAP